MIAPIIDAVGSSGVFFLKTIIGTTSWLYSLTPGFERHYHKDNKIIGLVKTKAEELCLGKEVQVKFVETNFFAQANGIKSSPFRCEIIINPNVLPDGLEGFIIAHELAHIKSNDAFTIPGIGFLASLTSSIGLSILLSIGVLSAAASSGFILVAVVIGAVAQIAFSQYREAQADKKALSVCTLEEKRKAKKFLEQLQEDEIKYRNEKNISVITQIYRKLTISKTGEFRLDIMHPSLASRIEMIQKSITDQANPV
jgi:hypothetical protein